ncbi:MAG TPA: hypothetical protein VHR66_08100 [Gemmataceae bacterium]|nr:hypothetical protein [Gemmataceae bacterium]
MPPVDPPASQESRLPGPNDGVPPTNTNHPPVIDITSCIQMGGGVYIVTGIVRDEHPGGLTVYFGGVPSAVGVTTVTYDDGSFCQFITLQTNGLDAGALTAKVFDDIGQYDEDYSYVNPTPP